MNFYSFLPHEVKCMQCPRTVKVYGKQSYVVCDKCLNKQARKNGRR